MAVIVADTDVLIDALRGREPVAGAVAREIEAANLATTVVTAFELLSGVREERQGESVDALLGALPLLPLDARAVRAGARVRRELEARGEPIGLADYLVAGICLTHSASLMTRNRRHFERVAGLTLI